MQLCDEGYADLRHELNLVKQVLDTVATEVWNQKIRQGQIMQDGEPGKRKWQVVVDWCLCCPNVEVMLGTM